MQSTHNRQTPSPGTYSIQKPEGPGLQHPRRREGASRGPRVSKYCRLHAIRCLTNFEHSTAPVHYSCTRIHKYTYLATKPQTCIEDGRRCFFSDDILHFLNEDKDDQLDSLFMAAFQCYERSVKFASYTTHEPHMNSLPLRITTTSPLREHLLSAPSSQHCDLLNE